MKKGEIIFISLLNIFIAAYLLGCANDLIINIEYVLGNIKFLNGISSINIKQNMFNLIININKETYIIRNKSYIPIIILIIINIYVLIKTSIKLKKDENLKNNNK